MRSPSLSLRLASLSSSTTRPVMRGSLISVSKGRLDLASWMSSRLFSTSQSSDAKTDRVLASTRLLSDDRLKQPKYPISNLPPTSTSLFPEILSAGFPFVDKTGLIGNLFEDYHRVFLARPRKWGKSTLLSTMKMILEGGDENRELLKNLDIVKRASEFSWMDWKPRPVLVFDFSNLDESVKMQPFRIVLMDMIRDLTRKYEIDIHEFDHGDNLKFFFSLFLRSLSRKVGTQVSVLVDDFDAPVLNALESSHLSEEDKHIRAEEDRQTLQDFFTSLKSMDAYTYRCFKTGLIKFPLTGIFSGANDFYDITFNEEFSLIAGYTWKEIETAYAPLLDRLAETVKVQNRGELRRLFEKSYGGYSWFDGGTKETRLFNPWDVNNCLEEQKIIPYWTQNAPRSCFLNRIDPNFLRRKGWTDREYSLSRMRSLIELSQFMHHQYVDTARLLIQNGYLTIKSGHFGDGDWMMKIGFPNGLIEKYVQMELTQLLLRVQSDR